MTYNHINHRLLGSAFALTLAVSLSACTNPVVPEENVAQQNEPTAANQPPAKANPKRSVRTPTTPATVTPSIEHANNLLKQGRKKEAADMYYRAAIGFPSPQRERVILQAAEITASLGESGITNQYLKRVPRSALVGENLPRYQYILALLALQSKQPNQALGLLPKSTSGLPAGLSEKIILVRKRAIEMGGTANTTQRSPTNPQAPRANRPPLVTTAPTVTMDPQEPPPQQNVVPVASNKLAVLLPQNGALGAVSQEIYQGIQDAQSRYGDTRSQMYDISPANALSQYQQAVADGADIVIGPLDKDSLSVLLANQGALSIPVLSLNYSDSRTPANLYRFGLSPEDEARQVAEFSIGRGQSQAIVMVPDSSWGKRLAEAFIQTYQSRGGRILNLTSYTNQASTDYLGQVNAALASGAGAQMVFLGASPTQARLIRPLLQAKAGSLPVYATSHIYSGRPEKAKNVDLDGIIYTEVPMILDGEVNGNLETLQYPRLYALGSDAVLIAKNLQNLSRQGKLHGRTGEISLDGNRNIQRRLSMATFASGEPRSLGN